MAAMENVKRVARAAARRDERFDWLDDRPRSAPGVDHRFLEMKTVWHPIGI